ERFAHRRIVYSHAGDAGRPAARIVFEVVDAVPVCTSFALWSSEGGQTHVRAKDLSGLERLRDEAYSAAGGFTRNPAGGWARPVGPATLTADRARVKRAGTPARRMTPELLARVAEIHNNTPPGGRLEAIRAAFHPTVSERTALRYIAAAKK